MGTRLSDSPMYAHLWGTDELAEIFSDEARLQAWLDILVALAEAQEQLDIIPAGSAARIAAAAKVELLDLDYVAEETRRTGHSTLGLIHGLQRVIAAPAREYVYFGATVQDLTDTWTGIVMREVGAIAWRDLCAIETTLLELAARHRDTVMAARTHGQPGATMTFGLKVASWADEIFRHRERLWQGRSRWLVGQLAGAAGTLAFFGPRGPALRAAFCAKVGLTDPHISWTTARDRIAEFAQLLASICATLARIGGEVYELQRPELGELREPATGVSSITMPHKRNPERSEHLDTLARLVRSSAAVLLESMNGQHERDGRTWKAEWIALPEVCLLSGAALSMGRGLLDGLEVDAERMTRNVHTYLLGTEQVLAELSTRLGKHEAQQLLHELLRESDEPDLPAQLAKRGVATADDVRSWLGRDATEVAGRMVDFVVERGTAALARHPAW